MRTALLLALALVAGGIVALPAASACDGEDPCDPPPMPLCPTTPDTSGPKPHGAVVEWLLCWL